LEQICGAQTDGSTRKFSESKQELYYHALRNDRKTNAKTKKNKKETTFNTVQETKNKENICVPNLGILKGQTVRKKTEQVRISHYAPIPEIYRKVVLAIDIMHVNDIPFLITISRNVQFGSAQALSLMKHTLQEWILIMQECKMMKMTSLNTWTSKQHMKLQLRT